MSSILEGQYSNSGLSRDYSSSTSSNHLNDDPKVVMYVSAEASHVKKCNRCFKNVSMDEVFKLIHNKRDCRLYDMEICIVCLHTLKACCPACGIGTTSGAVIAVNQNEQERAQEITLESATPQNRDLRLIAKCNNYFSRYVPCIACAGLCAIITAGTLAAYFSTK